ncbi:hypothetical protein PINS_up023365 [Pythium insidiosum]|nr:hypothetical protein PINS_up023365 [Pythium insidiosum]
MEINIVDSDEADAASSVPAPSARPAVALPQSPAPRDALRLFTIDLSPLESRLDDMVARLSTLEIALLQNVVQASGSPPPHDTIASDLAQAHTPPIANVTSSTSASSSATPLVSISDVAKELEGIRALHLRLRIDHETARSGLQLDVESLREIVSRMPQHADLHNARIEMETRVTSALNVWQHRDAADLLRRVDLALATHDVNENSWKAQFEEVMQSRINDMWAAQEALTQETRATLELVQRDVISLEDTVRETRTALQSAQLSLAELTQRMTTQEREREAQDAAIIELHAMLHDAKRLADSRDAVLTKRLQDLTTRLDDDKATRELREAEYDTWRRGVDRTQQAHTEELVQRQAAHNAHQEQLQLMDTVVTRHTAELGRLAEYLHRNDVRLGALDGRLVQSEKQHVTLTNVLQETHQALQAHVTETERSFEHAASERLALRRSTNDVSITIQEVQQSLHAVSKMASTTELALTRTANEIPRLHAMVATQGSALGKARQQIDQLGEDLSTARRVTQQLEHRLGQHESTSASQIEELLKRDDETAQQLATTQQTMQHTREELEEQITYNARMLNQLNTMVDTLAIAEGSTATSTDAHEDRLARFALQCAELGLQLEHFVASPGNARGGAHVTSEDPATASLAGGGGASVQPKDEVNRELAVLLARVVRFLASGVAVDQNRYLLSSKRLVASANGGGAHQVLEAAPMGILDSFRAAKVSMFVSRMRSQMDDLAPVASTTKHIIAWRDHFSRQVAYVLTFGLANLFPNVGRPRNPHDRRADRLGTCIACDRPLEMDDGEDAEARRRRVRNDSLTLAIDDEESCRRATTIANDPEVERLDDQRMRRSRLLSSSVSALPQDTPAVSAEAFRHKVDTRSQVKGRSGGSSSYQQTMQSKAVVHHAPGTTEYIYRAGFRLPRPSSAASSATGKGAASPAEIAALTALVASSSVPVADDKADAKVLDDNVTSCLERVALVGGREPVAVPRTSTTTIAPAAVASVRPMSAPHRAKSLPRLEPATSTSIES